MALATFLHISDLHFGDVDPSSFDAQAPALWAKWGAHFDGLLGHSYKSLMRVEQFYADLVADGRVHLIVTGDLTAVGSGDQFETANEYLKDVLRPPRGNFLGLRLKNWADLSIPGNHDHWSGKASIVGGPTASLRKFFPTMPREYTFRLSSGHILRFLMLDSDADVSPYGSNRVLARGCFTSQLAALAKNLNPPAPREVRVLLLHHSISARGLTLQMTDLSRSALQDFIVDHDISVLLCGHIHQPPFLSHSSASHLMQSKLFLEARCGTTTQISTLPLQWKTLLGHRPKREAHWPNSLMVHDILEEGNGALTWRSRVFLEQPAGFRFAPQLPDGSAGHMEFALEMP